MRRRRFIASALASALSAPGAQAGAQQPGQVFRIGLLNSTSAEINEVMFATLRDGLAARGYVQGRNVVYDAAYADSRSDRIPGLARALVQRRPDVIVAYTTEVTQAVAAATDTIPIVMTIGNDPVAAGLTTSFARPSRNVTGFSTSSDALASKRLDYLLQFTPRMMRVGLLYGDGNALSIRDATQAIALTLGIAIVPVVVTESAGVVSALTAAMALPLDGVIVNADPVTYPATPDIVEFAIARRVPAIYTLRHMAVDGGLMALGYDPFDNARGTADYVARILGGAPVASLPFQQPRRLIFTLNLATARRSNIAVPATLIALADEVID